MLRDHAPIDLEAGQLLTIVAVGDEYDTWEGYKDPTTGEVSLVCGWVACRIEVKSGGFQRMGSGLVRTDPGGSRLPAGLRDLQGVLRGLQCRSVGLADAPADQDRPQLRSPVSGREAGRADPHR